MPFSIFLAAAPPALATPKVEIETVTNHTTTDLGERLVQPLASDHVGERQPDRSLLAQALQLSHPIAN